MPFDLPTQNTLYTFKLSTVQLLTPDYDDLITAPDTFLVCLLVEVDLFTVKLVISLSHECSYACSSSLSSGILFLHACTSLCGIVLHLKGNLISFNGKLETVEIEMEIETEMEN